MSHRPSKKQCTFIIGNVEKKRPMQWIFFLITKERLFMTDVKHIPVYTCSHNALCNIHHLRELHTLWELHMDKGEHKI
jgi:hypothetical protein